MKKRLWRVGVGLGRVDDILIFWCESHEERTHGLLMLKPHDEDGTPLGEKMIVPWTSAEYIVFGNAEYVEVTE